MDGENRFPVICPLCKSRVATMDRRTKIDKFARCKRCKKLIIYRVDTATTEVKPLPARTCASGMTFI